MSPVVIAAVAALVAGAGVRDEGILVAWAPLPAQQELNPLLLGALATPPSVVVRTTRRYGEVTIDHAKHLALRAPCGDCHVTLPVSKITFTPQLAHRGCIGCHKERAAGPTQCAGCHVRSLPTEPVIVVEGGFTGDDGTSGSGPLPAPPPPPTAPRRGLAVRVPGAAPLAAAAGPTSRQIVEVGFVAVPGLGPSLRVSSRRERLVTMYSFERVAGDDVRLLGMLGAGLSHRVLERWEVVAVAMGGFDALESPAVTVLPAVGLRAELGWRPRWWRLDSVHLGVTGIVDLAHGESFGQEVGGTAVFLTVGTGVAVRGASLP